MHDSATRPGVIKSGDTYLKLSSTLNPFGYNTRDDESEDEDVLEAELEDAQESWKWEAEEDVPLTNVWHGKTVDLAKGILYVRIPPLLYLSRL
jgi:hypothetical protein